MKLFTRYESPAVGSRAIMAAIDAVSLLLIPRQPARRLPLSPDRVKSLLLLRLDGIGDNVCTWPALKLLREGLPGTRISMAVGPWAAPLYRECPWIDELIEWDSGLFGLFRGKGLTGLANDLRIAATLRARRFDAGIDLRGDLLSIALLKLVAPPIRVASTASGGMRMLTDPLETAAGHEARRTSAVASAALGQIAEKVPALHDWSRPKTQERALEKLRASGWNPALPTAALCHLALWPWKQWPADRFRELALRLRRDLGMQTVWFLENSAQAAELTDDDQIFCGPLDEVAAALGICSLAIANDSGLMHLAVAAGCRTVQLFGPGDAARFAHTGNGLIIHHDTTCRHNPCIRSGKCANLDLKWCLEEITVADVFSSCAHLMAQKPTG